MKKIVIIAALVCGAWQQADAQYVSKVWVPDQKDGTYINPIIHADYSDVSSNELLRRMRILSIRCHIHILGSLAGMYKDSHSS